MSDLMASLEEAMTNHRRALDAVEASRSSLAGSTALTLALATQESVRAADRAGQTGRALLEILGVS